VPRPERPVQPITSTHKVDVSVPDAPPQLTPDAARVLLRILKAAAAGEDNAA